VIIGKGPSGTQKTTDGDKDRDFTNKNMDIDMTDLALMGAVGAN